MGNWPASKPLSETNLTELENRVTTADNAVVTGKNNIYDAIVSKKVTPIGKTFANLVTAIGQIVLGSGNALPEHVLSPKTFTNSSGVQQTGTIPSKGAATYTPSQTAQTISSGQYLSGNQTISAVSFNAAKVLEDTTIAGKTGTVVIRGSQTATLSITGSAKPTKSISEGFVSASTITAQVSGQEANIRKDTVIGGCTGTLAPAYIATGRNLSNTDGYLSITNLSFRPKVVIATTGSASDQVNQNLAVYVDSSYNLKWLGSDYKSITIGKPLSSAVVNTSTSVKITNNGFNFQMATGTFSTEELESWSVDWIAIA